MKSKRRIDSQGRSVIYCSVSPAAHSNKPGNSTTTRQTVAQVARSLTYDSLPEWQIEFNVTQMKVANFTVLALLVLATFPAGCVKPPIISPSSQAAAEAAIDHAKARQLSDSIVGDLMKDDRASLRQKMEKGARDYFDEKSFGSVIDQMFAMYGKPLEAEYKMDEVGRKTGLGGYDKPVRKFWYAIRTTKHEKGSHFLTVEVVPDEGGLASSGFATVTFPLGVVPPSLK